MIEAQARVVGQLVEGRVSVVVERQSACAGCNAKAGCGTALIDAWFPQRRLQFEIDNAIGAQPGDRVVLGLDEASLQRHSLVLYGLPLGGLLGGALAGESLAAPIGASPELAAIISGLCGIVVGLLLVRRRSARRRGVAAIHLLRLATRRSVSFDGCVADPPSSTREKPA